MCFTRTSSPARSGAGSAASPSSLYCKAPCRRLSVSGTVRSGILRAALACLAPWGCVRGWRCSGRWHGAGRQQQQRRGGYSGAPWRTAVATLGTAAVPSAAVLRGYCGSTTRCAAAWAGSARLVRGRGGSYALYRGARPCCARTEGHSVVVWVLGRPRSMMRRHTRSAPPIRTARRAPSRPITRRSPSHRRPMGRGRGLRSAIARGGSCSVGAPERRCDANRLSQVS